MDLAWHGEIAEQNPAVYAAIAAAGETHGPGMQSYLIMMAVRLLEMHRLLKETGSLYLHCDPAASHYLKLLLDAVFGPQQFRNEIVWHYYNKYGVGKRVFGRNYDQILFYSRTDRYAFTPQREPREKPVRQLQRVNVGGVLKNRRDADGQLMYRTVTDRKVDAVWRIPAIQPASRQYMGYPTQKHERVLSRIILASSEPGDLVLDPFAGCATTCVAAEHHERQWVGIDLSPLAAELVERRLRDRARTFARCIRRDDIPQRTDIGDLPAYRTHKHHLYGQQEGVCAGCRVFFPFRNFTVDHIVPSSQGGTDHRSNLQLLCGACNSLKGDRPQAYLLSVLRERGVLQAS